MLYPIIDIGSNTVKLSVLEPENLFRRAPVFFKAIPLGLKNKTVNGHLPESAINELSEIVNEYIAISSRLTETKPIAFATASLRGLDNLNEVKNAVKIKTGIDIDLISGETEASCSFLGSLEGRKNKSGITVDMGGGSTEIISFSGTNQLSGTSLPFGCLTLTSAFYRDSQFNEKECTEYIRTMLEKSAPESAGNEVLLSGGSAKAVLKYRNTVKNRFGFSMTEKELCDILFHYFTNEKDKKRLIAELKDRYVLVPSAVCTFKTILNFYGKSRFTVCKNGVREGYLIKYLEKNKKCWFVNDVLQNQKTSPLVR